MILLILVPLSLMLPLIDVWAQDDATSEAVPKYKLLVNGNEFEIPWYMKTGKISSIGFRNDNQ